MRNPPVVKAVVLAAGAGRRLPSERPKQYLPLGGEPMVLHCLEAAQEASSISAIVLVVPPAGISRAREMIANRFPKVGEILEGGARRQDSVLIGALAAGECDVLLVHDAARPFARAELFDAVALEAARCGAAIAAIPVADTVKEVDASGGVVKTIDRSRLVLSQTPQAFQRSLLIEALERARLEGTEATDEAVLFEVLGGSVRTVAGSKLNLKVTYPEDVIMARALTDDGFAPEVRVGIGEDIHPLAEGRALWIGGVRIPFEKGLVGHSDGDVLVHAVIDALCGAASFPNIGELFPESDLAWMGASSLEMLRLVREKLNGEGWTLVNLDSVVLCQAPRLAGQLDEMRATIAGAIGVDPGRIGVKGKSAEGIAAEGRGEAISARAVALLRKAPPARAAGTI